MNQLAVTKFNIQQSPDLVPDCIPRGTLVEIIREVKQEDFFSGKGYIIFWEEKCYADVVDSSRVDLVPVFK